MDSCKRGFLTQDELDKHIQNRHINPKPIKFVCKICEKEDESGKQAHIKANHIDKDGNIKCPKCDKICTSYGLGWFALAIMKHSKYITVNAPSLTACLRVQEIFFE